MQDWIFYTSKSFQHLFNSSFLCVSYSRLCLWSCWTYYSMVWKENEIHTRPVELLPKLTFTVYASFIVTCFICRQQLATFLHGHILDTHCFQLTFNIARLNWRNNFMCWFAVTVNERSEVNRNKMKTIHTYYMWMVIICNCIHGFNKQ